MAQQSSVGGDGDGDGRDGKGRDGGTGPGSIQAAEKTSHFFISIKTCDCRKTCWGAGPGPSPGPGSGLLVPKSSATQRQRHKQRQDSKRSYKSFLNADKCCFKTLCCPVLTTANPAAAPPSACGDNGAAAEAVGAVNNVCHSL